MPAALQNAIATTHNKSAISTTNTLAAGKHLPAANCFIVDWFITRLRAKTHKIMEGNSKKKIVVIGGGFAGLNFLKHIDADKFEVTLIDRHNYHSFPPLFYQVASSGLDPASICFPLRRELRKRHGDKVRYSMGEAREIDIARRIVITTAETVPYDFLILAAGTTNNFFNMPQLADDVFTIKSTPEALRCRNEVLSLLERASIEPDAEKRRKMLSFVVVGGGPSGVEIAGALGEMKKYVLPREYPSISPDDITITLVEGNNKVLATMNEKSSEAAAKSLRELMVDLRFGAFMANYQDNVLTLSDGTKLPASMVIWTAGVKAEGFTFTSHGMPLTESVTGHAGRFPVDRFCRVNNLQNVFALGDISLVEGDPDYPKGHPQLAQVAIQQGRLVAKNLNRDSVDAGEWKTFRYNDKGSMATIGRNRAVVDLKHLHFSGFVAWLMWMFIHLISILGMRNKIAVLVNWTWAYFNYSTSLRLLIGPARKPDRDRPAFK